MTSWQPIETALKESEEIQLALRWDDGTYTFAVGSWWVKGWYSFSHSADTSRTPILIDPQPTHWMPLPEPPDSDDD